MDDMGIVQKLSSPWSSPLHMVLKSPGGWRPCGDYHRLNEAITPDRYPIPHIQDISANLSDCNIFAKIDLVRGYQQKPVAKEDVPKVAVITPFGLFGFLCRLFGLKNATQAFLRFTDNAIRDLNVLLVYLGDILVASRTEREHLQHLSQLLECLSEFGLIINASKCLFRQRQLDFLGHRIASSGSLPLPDKITAITNFAQPTTVKGLQEFVSMINFYNRFIPSAAQIMRPLYQALAGKPRILLWSADMLQAFQGAK